MNWYKRANAMEYFSDPINGGHMQLPVVWLRFGPPPLDEQGRPVPSMNHLDQVREKGVSVYPAWKDPKTGKYLLPSGGEQYLSTLGALSGGSRQIYELTGTALSDSGADGEPLLDPATIRIVGTVNPSQVHEEQNAYLSVDGQEWEDGQYPEKPIQRRANNWYKTSKNRLRNHFRRLQDDYADDGVSIWTKGDDVFVSFGDWAKDPDEVIYEIKRFVGDSGKVISDTEVGSPGPGWIRV
jgi:hypothetical protein